ncbi:hypothetical protein Krad_0977 [Kineococcus radiotolerans SRS30216 = ATCC BAA-149]|uniref:Uncharacterized protein n=2 Tax=Kineococcus radiotolerans TaxID=131568 RepID=A6W6M6_KINRD|nr:hypothetical protein Krad_0977 [Kineococcus radiotolerans SRS30216 = ATCC BAA-149]
MHPPVTANARSPGGQEITMDKSPRGASSKKSGKSLKEKRADKKDKNSSRSAADAVADSVKGSHRGR